MGGGALQVKAKYNGQLVELFREVFCHLPLAHCLNSRVLVVHGGLFSQDGVTLDDIRKVDRNMCAAQLPLLPFPQNPPGTVFCVFCSWVESEVHFSAVYLRAVRYTGSCIASHIQ